MNASQAVEKIQKAATAPDVETRVTRRIEIGQAVHQGDVYLHRVPSNWPRGAHLGTRQVAVGNTVGARHVAEGEGVDVFEGKKYPKGFTEPKDCAPNALLGPVVVVTDDLTLTHPEHAHHALRCGEGVYQVTYQYNPRVMRAVQD